MAPQVAAAIGASSFGSGVIRMRVGGPVVLCCGLTIGYVRLAGDGVGRASDLVLFALGFGLGALGMLLVCALLNRRGKLKILGPRVDPSGNVMPYSFGGWGLGLVGLVLILWRVDLGVVTDVASGALTGVFVT